MRLAGDLRGPASGVPVFVGALRSDEPTPHGQELALRIGALVGGSVGGAATAQTEPLTLATAHALARKAKGFVFVQPEIARGELRVTADLFLVVRNVWDRVRQLAPAPVAHSFAGERIDAEVRGYLGAVAPLAGKVERFRVDDRDVAALACADADDDGIFEIVTVGRHRATVGRIQSGAYVPTHVAVLKDLLDVAPIPLREPLASTVIVPSQDDHPGYIDVGITDRSSGLRFDARLGFQAKIGGVPFPGEDGDICARFEGTTLNAYLQPCTPLDGAPSAQMTGPMPLDVLYDASIVNSSGTVRHVRASHNPSVDALDIEVDADHLQIAHAGAQVAVADLDGDGDPEIISTLDPLPAPAPGTSALRADPLPTEADALIVNSWHAGSPLKERLRVPVPTGVRAVAACPPDSLGPSAILLATPGELWVVR